MTPLDTFLTETKRKLEEAALGKLEWWNGCSWWRLGIEGTQDTVLKPTIDSDGHPNLVCSKELRDFIASAPEHTRKLLEMVEVAELALRGLSAIHHSEPSHPSNVALEELNRIAEEK